MKVHTAFVCLFVCLFVMMIDFVVKMGKNYKPQVFVEEFKCIVKENKRIKFIIDALELGFLMNFF